MDYVEYEEVADDVNFSSFRPEINFLDKLHPKKNCLLKPKFGIKPAPNILNLPLLFTFSVLNQKDPILWQICSKIQNCLFKLKFVNETNLDVLNSIVRFSFYALSWNNLFGQILPKKMKFVLFKLKFVTQPTQKC